jgi:hypothetical protein
MAARTRKVGLDENHRAAIKTSQLINRLTDHAHGKVELQPTQVKAIEILLRKSLPDLSSIEMKADVTVNHDRALAEIEEQIKAGEVNGHAN